MRLQKLVPFRGGISAASRKPGIENACGSWQSRKVSIIFPFEWLAVSLGLFFHLQKFRHRDAEGVADFVVSFCVAIVVVALIFW